MTIYNKIYTELGILENKNDNSLLNNLTKIPPKEPRDVMPHTSASKIFATEQIDTLYMPNDHGYKYILVVVDIATRKMDAEPMKQRDNNSIIKALTEMFKRKIIKKPLRMEVDDGTEFKGEFEKHYKKFFQVLRKMSGRRVK